MKDFSARVRKVLRELGYGSVVEHSTRILTSVRGSGCGSEASILQSGAGVTGQQQHTCKESPNKGLWLRDKRIPGSSHPQIPPKHYSRKR